ncbi:hypothetical protein CKM354_000588900 [Cercospora kikuchii]|uniref:MYND-type domain-containing protein n=1 Tax=Cercospora kikuchii TaxID=84275 RepID=A0A9P3FH88_9PEZI|nr:uncharacterized protein CKM354_000588900 [Cercospora kikuchii]GIZ42629.1 hypothetical protein CKM354_000588900 [Cercospora kikuchii]
MDMTARYTIMMSVWAYAARDSDNPSYVLMPKSITTRSSGADLTWKEVPFLSRLGVKGMIYATPTEEHHCFYGIEGLHENTTIRLLSTDCDPDSPTFNTSIKIAGPVHFQWVGVQDLLPKKFELEPMELFIEERLAAIKCHISDPERRKHEYEQLNPKAFKMFFKKYTAERAVLWPGKGWETNACPAVVEVEHCEGCGVERSGDGEEEHSDQPTFQKCGRCKKVLYCDKACQSSDWKAHKPFCKRSK